MITCVLIIVQSSLECSTSIRLSVAYLAIAHLDHVHPVCNERYR